MKWACSNDVSLAECGWILEAMVGRNVENHLSLVRLPLEQMLGLKSSLVASVAVCNPWSQSNPLQMLLYEATQVLLAPTPPQAIWCLVLSKRSHWPLWFAWECLPLGFEFAVALGLHAQQNWTIPTPMFSVHWTKQSREIEAEIEYANHSSTSLVGPVLLWITHIKKSPYNWCSLVAKSLWEPF